MATRKDQLDAFVFARRRMVANLVAPSPTGSDEAAPRPVKTFFTSAILSAIAVAGVAVLGVFRPSAPSGWESGLAVDSSSGAAYVYSPQDKELHPVLNITSARLLLGKSFKKFDVPDSVINGQGVTIGAPFGIPGAPPDVPTAGNVDITQWMLCLDSADHGRQSQPGGKTILEVGYGPGGESTTSQIGFVVHDSQNTNYLVTGDYAYPVADNGALNPLASVSVGPGKPAGPWVSAAWLSAFRSGAPLQLPTVAGLGDPVTLPNQPGTHIGDYGVVTGANSQDGYIETRDGLVEVSYFVYKLYTAGPAGLQNSGAHEMTNLTVSTAVHALPKDERANPTSLLKAGGDWPQSMPTTLDSDAQSSGFGVFCVNYSGSFDGDVPHLTLYYGTQLPKPLPTGVTVQGTGQTYADYVMVEPGHAALARNVSGGNSQNSGPQFLVTDTGLRYLMTPTATLPGTGGPNGQATTTSAAAQLQYKDGDKDVVHVTPVPDNWLRLVQSGAELNPEDAGKTPPLTGN